MGSREQAREDEGSYSSILLSSGWSPTGQSPACTATAPTLSYLTLSLRTINQLAAESDGAAGPHPECDHLPRQHLPGAVSALPRFRSLHQDRAGELSKLETRAASGLNTRALLEDYAKSR